MEKAQPPQQTNDEVNLFFPQISRSPFNKISLKRHEGVGFHEFQLAILPPSIVAVSCLCVAFGRLMGDEDASSRMLFALQPILKVDTFVYEPYVETVRQFLNSMSSGGNQSSTSSFENEKSSPESSTTGTPTDIRDVDFS
uniref:Uncharacterized protein n=1 Tax=Romanomermis culicivorax TaxID=13658 RepID=A0A915JMI3_ROMCU